MTLHNNKKRTPSASGRGTIVMIFTDPLTQTKPEGRARLLTRAGIDDVDGMTFWNVTFLGDHGAVYQRWVKNEN